MSLRSSVRPVPNTESRVSGVRTFPVAVIRFGENRDGSRWFWPPSLLQWKDQRQTVSGSIVSVPYPDRGLRAGALRRRE